VALVVNSNQVIGEVEAPVQITLVPVDEEAFCVRILPSSGIVIALLHAVPCEKQDKYCSADNSMIQRFIGLDLIGGFTKGIAYSKCSLAVSVIHTNL
jgi:hypothetical protein